MVKEWYRTVLEEQRRNVAQTAKEYDNAKAHGGQLRNFEKGRIGAESTGRSGSAWGMACT